MIGNPRIGRIRLTFGKPARALGWPRTRHPTVFVASLGALGWPRTKHPTVFVASLGSLGAIWRPLAVTVGRVLAVERRCGVAELSERNLVSGAASDRWSGRWRGHFKAEMIENLVGDG